MSTIRILEVGCGKGRNAAVLRRHFHADVVGIDLDPDTIAQAKRAHPDMEFGVMSLESLNFPDARFDRIYAIDVLEHVDNLQQSVNEMVRVLKPGGILVVNVPAEKSEQWLLRIRPTYHQEIHHVRIFKAGEITALFTVRGLQQRTHKRMGFIDHLLLYYLFTRTPSSDSQLGIGNWRDSLVGMVLFALQTYTKPELVFSSWLWIVPLWIIGIPLGWLVNGVGNHFFPKSMYYEFRKKSL